MDRGSAQTARHQDSHIEQALYLLFWGIRGSFERLSRHIVSICSRTLAVPTITEISLISCLASRVGAAALHCYISAFLHRCISTCVLFLHCYASIFLHFYICICFLFYVSTYLINCISTFLHCYVSTVLLLYISTFLYVCISIFLHFYISTFLHSYISICLHFRYMYSYISPFLYVYISTLLFSPSHLN